MLILAGYVLTAAVFYTYIVKTAGQEVQEQTMPVRHSGNVVEIEEWQRSQNDHTRKVA